MPISPLHNQPGSSSTGRGRSHPTSKNRNKKRALRDQYVAIREEAQLRGIIPTTPEGAVKPEVVNTTAPPQSELVEQAIKKGWAVPEDMKPHLVQEMIDIVQGSEAEAKHKIAAFRALQVADKDQYEREHPEEKKANTSQVNVKVGVQVGEVFSDIERDTKIILGETTGDVSQDGAQQPVDEAQPTDTEEKPEATRLPDGM